MQRRNFLRLGLGAVVLGLAPLSVMAKNYREELPEVWKIKNKSDKPDDLSGINEAIKAIFGTDKVEEGKIELYKTPDIAENGAVVPVNFKTEKASRIALLQNANPEALVAIWDIPELGIPDYGVRIKMAKTGTVVVVAEIDGKLYKASKLVKVTAGGCGG